MTDKKLKIPKLLLALVFAATFILPFMAAVFTAKPLAARAASYYDINVGDYIDGFGGLKWRVIGKDENGLLVRTDRSVDYKFFDEPKAGREYTNNNIMYYDAIHYYARTTYGTNYWEEADMKYWLNDTKEGFASCFDDDEWAIIAEVPQRQILWWGETTEYYDANTYVPDFEPIANVSGGESFVTNSGDSDLSDILQNYNDAYAYTITDKIFLPDIKQAYESSVLQNADGNPYHIVLDQTGAAVASWLRTPAADNRLGNSFVRYISAAGTVPWSVACGMLIAPSPALYLSPSVSFPNARASALAEGEQDGYTVYGYVGEPDPNAEAVAADKAALSWDAIRYENILQAEITSDLWLPAFGASETEISWVCDKPQIISAAGAVTRPAYGDGDADVILTAIIGRGSASDDIVFALTVKKAPRVAGTQAPTINAQPIGSTVKKGARLTLSFMVTAQEDNILSCQWYSNTAESNSGGAVINGATGSDYSPPTDKEGTAYYYCVIASLRNGLSVTSRAAAVTVTDSGGISGGAVTGIVMIVLAALGGGAVAFIIIKKRKSGGAA